jgi:GH15 family glucan-1,4-alpha-glucosidase
MPLVKFISPTDARWLSTLDAIGRELTIDALVFRYSTHDEGVNLDGLEGIEGAFTPCSFWYVECLARAGRVEQAQLLFEKTLSYANHLGLYAEELGASGDHLGNFPQAWTHLALISAAYALNNAIDSHPPDAVSR